MTAAEVAGAAALAGKVAAAYPAVVPQEEVSDRSFWDCIAIPLSSNRDKNRRPLMGTGGS